MLAVDVVVGVVCYCYCCCYCVLCLLLLCLAVCCWCCGVLLLALLVLPFVVLCCRWLLLFVVVCCYCMFGVARGCPRRGCLSVVDRRWLSLFDAAVRRCVRVVLLLVVFVAVVLFDVAMCFFDVDVLVHALGSFLMVSLVAAVVTEGALLLSLLLDDCCWLLRVAVAVGCLR